MMIRLLLFLLSCATLLAQKTPFKVNGTVINNPNLKNSGTITWTIVGADITGAAAGGGGGGDTIWTNNAGLIELIGSTDVILNPAVSDGAGAVAFSLNSSNALSTSGSKLLAIGNNTTNRFVLDYLGNISQGVFIQSEYGNEPGNILRSLRFTDSGDPDSGNIYSESANNSDYDVDSYYLLSTRSVDASSRTFLELNAATGSAGVIRADVNLNVNDPTQDSVFFRITHHGVKFLANPTAADGDPTLISDSSFTHTSGNLAEFNNNGTNRFIVGFSGYSQNGLSGEGRVLSFVNEIRSAITTFGSDTSTINFASGDGNVSITATLANGDEGFHFQPTTTSAITPYVLDTDITHDGGNLFEVKNNTTNKAWVTFDGEVHAKDFVMEASSLRTSDTAGHSGLIQAHDDDDNVRRTFVTLQNGNTPSLVIAPPSGGTVTLQGILKAADGTSGITTNITAGLVTFTVKNGIIVGVSL